MHPILTKTIQRFKSEVPPLVKKFQILLGTASGFFTGGSAIPWPGKLGLLTNICNYGAAICAGTVLSLQFMQRSAAIIEAPPNPAQPQAQPTSAQ
jgi:hypothetical protein